MSHKPSAVALCASLLYAVVGGLWILFSDRLVVEIIRDPETIERVEIFKGWFFVTFTATLFFLILRRLLAREKEKQQELMTAEALTKLQRDALEMITKGRPLSATLETLVRGIETQLPGSHASILLLDPDGVHLRHGAAPSLPEEYVKAIDGASIGAKAGSCGTAAFRGSPVFVGDIAQDPLWNDFKHLALPHGLRACWSTPIFDEQKKVLGTFAVYHSKPGLPDENQVRIVEIITQTAAAAIEKARTEKSLQESEERFRTLLKQASDAIFVHDLSGQMVDANEQACASLGYSREELLRLTAADIEVGFSPTEIRDLCQNLQPGQFKIANGRHRRKDGTTFAVEASLSVHHLHGRELTLALVRNVTERREYEEQLARSVSLLQATIESGAGGILAVDNDGKITAYNQRFLQLWNIPETLAAEAAEAVVLELVRQKLPDPDAFLSRVQELNAQPEAESFDTLEFKDGRVFERSSRPQRLGGNIVGRVWSFWDVTERRQTEANLRQERELLRTLVDLAPDFIFIKDADSRFLMVNSALATCYGRTPEKMLGHTDADFLPPELAAHFRASEQRVMAANSFLSFEDSVTFPDGKTRTVMTNMVAFRGDQGKVRGLVGIGRDITAERSIEKSMRLQSAALEAAANAILIADHNGSIEWVNPAFTRSTGYALAECLGKKPRHLLRSGRHDRQFYQQLWNTILAGQVWHGELINRRKDGSLYPEEMTITPLLDHGNRTTHFVAIKQDITERKRLEEELRAASERTKFYMNRMPLGFIAWDREFRVAEWNAAAEVIFGWPTGEAIGRHAYDLIVPPDVQPLVNMIWEQILASGSAPSHSINDNVTREGRRITCEWRNTPWRDASGEICGMLSIVNDITEQRRAEEQFAREQARFKLIFDTMPVGIAFHTIHPDGSVTRLVNDAHLRICGLTQEQSNDIQNYINITHPDDRAVQKKLMAEIIASQVKRFTLERRYVHPDQSVVWVNLSFQRETHPDGTIEELTTLVDNTERKTVEQQLRQLAVIVESSEDAIIGKTLAGVITSWNRGAERIFGYPAGEAIGNTMLLLFPSELKQEEADILARIARGENIEHFQTERIRKDGKRIRVSATISPLKDGLGKIVGAATIARDITHQHMLEEQLRQSQKMEAIGQLAGGVAHDFNNILAVIQMQGELSKIAGHCSSEQAACLDEIQTAANRGANLTRQLLLFSRRQRLQPRELDLSDSITGMTKMLWRILGEHVQIQFKYAPQPLFILADAGMMDQVVMNLTLNARDAMPNGGRVGIETAAVELDELAALQSPQARPGMFVRLSVSDTGCGIPPQILPRIFEPFFTTKDVGKGTGLGLATVFSIVQQHQGWISVESEPGRGTAFHIFLPRLIKAAARQAASSFAPTTATGGNETILLVEDDDALRASVHKCLTRLGYRLLEAASGVAALEVWQRHRETIDLLLTDLVMPGGMSGKELGERLLGEKSNLKVIHMSGYSAEVLNKKSPAAGITFLSKPFPTQALAQTIRACLDKS